jgi:hypothetical protein
MARFRCGRALGALAVIVVLPGLANGSDIRRNLRGAPGLVRLTLPPTYGVATDELTAIAARAVPIPASTSAFTYRFDPVTGTYQRTNAESMGGATLFIERPETIGRYVWAFGVSGQYLELDEFDGETVGTDPDPILVAGDPIEFQARPKIVYHVATLQATYGVLDDLDLNVAVPLTALDFDVNARRAAPGGPAFLNTKHGNVSLGVMDMLVRAKYQLTRHVGFPAALGLVVRVPSGDPDKALGTGEAEVGPYVYLAHTYWGRVEPQVNAGINASTEPDESSAQWAAGVNVHAITNRLDVGFSFNGRHEKGRRLERSSVSGLHLTPSGPALTPYGGYDFGRKDMIDVVVGTRVRVYKTLALAVSVVKALNEDGLRSSEWSPSGAIEATF